MMILQPAPPPSGAGAAESSAPLQTEYAEWLRVPKLVLLHQKSEGGALGLSQGHFRSFLTISRKMGAKTPALAQILPIFWLSGRF